MKKLAIALSMCFVVVSAGPGRAAEWVGIDVTLRDDAGDAVRSDGNPVYGGPHDASGIIDADSVNSTSGRQDVLFFRTSAKRRFLLDLPELPDGTQTCDGASAHVSVFSRQTPDWFTLLMSLPIGSTIAADSGVRCWRNGNDYNYYVDYPGSELDAVKGPECGSVTKVGETTLRFEVPESCVADVYRIKWERGEYVEEKLPSKVSAPFQMTVSIEEGRARP